MMAVVGPGKYRRHPIPSHSQSDFMLCTATDIPVCFCCCCCRCIVVLRPR